MVCRRQFDDEALQQLALIALGKRAGFSLTEISGMVGKGGATDLPRGTLHARADAIDRQIRGLKALRDMIRHVAECPAETHMDCPKFRKLLRLAVRRQEG